MDNDQNYRFPFNNAVHPVLSQNTKRRFGSIKLD